MSQNHKKRCVFYFAAIFLLLGAIAAVVIQKQNESAAAIAVAINATERHHIQDANFWGIVSLAAAALAIFSWVIAIWCHEKHRCVLISVIVLLLFYVCLKLIIV
jgi:amino acid transporter